MEIMLSIPKIIDPDGLASEFIKEWLSDSPVVYANTSGSTGAQANHVVEGRYDCVS